MLRSSTFIVLLVVPLASVATACSPLVGDEAEVPDGDVVQLPDGEAGIGLDDLRFSSTLGQLVVAAGRTGNVVLVDPATLEVAAVGGFTASATFNGGDQQGVESADEGGGLVYAVDRTTFTLSVIDPAQGAVVATTELERTEPDYVRFSEARSEVWISNPGTGRVEVLTVAAPGDAPVHAAFIDTGSGPEGIALDDERGLAYVHGSQGTVVVMDMAARAVVDVWSTSCASSHGIPVVDGERPFLYVGCANASVVVLDVDDGGAEVGAFTLGGGASIIAYAPLLRHLYLRGDGETDVVTLAVSSDGALRELARDTTTSRGHCMVADDDGGLWVCDRAQGRLLRFHDAQPETRR